MLVPNAAEVDALEFLDYESGGYDYGSGREYGIVEH